jgi:hypothetical protein
MNTTDITTIVFASVPTALERMDGQGGWFFWDYNADVCFWFPMEWNQDNILASAYLKGRSGYLAMHGDLMHHYEERPNRWQEGEPL